MHLIKKETEDTQSQKTRIVFNVENIGNDDDSPLLFRAHTTHSLSLIYDIHSEGELVKISSL